MKLERLNRIEQYILSHKVASLDELCRTFGISVNTLRRDLNILETRGNIAKVYGGAKANLKSALVPMPVRSTLHAEEKYRIGQLAAQLVEDGDTIFIDSGSTTMQMIPFISGKKHLTVITHSLPVLYETSRHEGINLISLGGIYSSATHSFVGNSVLGNIGQIQIPKAFMATTAVSLDTGMMNTTLFEAEIKRSIISKSDQVYLLVDASKFNTRAMLTVCPLERVDCLVTDRRPPEAYIDFFDRHGKKVLY